MSANTSTQRKPQSGQPRRRPRTTKMFAIAQVTADISDAVLWPEPAACKVSDSRLWTPTRVSGDEEL